MSRLVLELRGQGYILMLNRIYLDAVLVLPKGIEPLFQPSEGCALSFKLREQ